MKKTKEATTQVVEVKANASAENLLSLAIEKNVPVETIERLVNLVNQQKAAWAKEQFTKAMAKFQASCPTIVKTKEVKTKSGQVAYRYAPIESIVEQVAQILQQNGFSYSSDMELIENGTTKVKVSIKITHEAGHSEVTEMTVPIGEKTQIMSNSQVVAAAQTFAKRYAFCNAFGILTGDEDTDARPQEEPVKQIETPTDYKKKIFQLAKMLNLDMATIKDEVKSRTQLDLSEVNYPEIVGRLELLVTEFKNA